MCQASVDGGGGPCRDATSRGTAQVPTRTPVTADQLHNAADVHYASTRAVDRAPPNASSNVSQASRGRCHARRRAGLTHPAFQLEPRAALQRDPSQRWRNSSRSSLPSGRMDADRAETLDLGPTSDLIDVNAGHRCSFTLAPCPVAAGHPASGRSSRSSRCFGRRRFMRCTGGARGHPPRCRYRWHRPQASIRGMRTSAPRQPAITVTRPPGSSATRAARCIAARRRVPRRCGGCLRCLRCSRSRSRDLKQPRARAATGRVFPWITRRPRSAHAGQHVIPRRCC